MSEWQPQAGLGTPPAIADPSAPTGWQPPKPLPPAPWSPTEAGVPAPVPLAPATDPPPVSDPIVVLTAAALTIPVAPHKHVARRRPSPKLVGSALVVLEVMALVVGIVVVWHFASRPVTSRASAPSVTTTAKRPVSTTSRTVVAPNTVATRSASAPVFVDASGPATVDKSASGPVPDPNIFDPGTVARQQPHARFDSISLVGPRVAASAFDHLRTPQQVASLFNRIDAFGNWLAPPNPAPEGQDLLHSLSLYLERTPTTTSVSRRALYVDGSADFATVERTWSAALSRVPRLPPMARRMFDDGGKARLFFEYRQVDETVRHQFTIGITPATEPFGTVGFLVSVEQTDFEPGGSNVTMMGGELWSLFASVPYDQSARVSQADASWSQSERRFTAGLVIELPQSIVDGDRDRMANASRWTAGFQPGAPTVIDQYTWQLPFAGTGIEGRINGTMHTGASGFGRITIEMTERLATLS
jgi:hypothetical protein